VFTCSSCCSLWLTFQCPAAAPRSVARFNVSRQFTRYFPAEPSPIFIQNIHFRSQFFIGGTVIIKVSSVVSDFGSLASAGAAVSGTTSTVQQPACEGQAAMVGLFTTFKVINRKRVSLCSIN
jgi:hypothetical protein